MRHDANLSFHMKKQRPISGKSHADWQEFELLCFLFKTLQAVVKPLN